MIASHPSQPWRDFRDVVEEARARPPGAIHYATSIAAMMHLATVRMCGLAGVRFTLVPYRGGAQALQDTLAGAVPLFPTNVAVGGPHVYSGALRGLAVTTRARWRELPDVPTLHELGFDGFEAATWWSVVAPAGVPAEVRRRMEAALSRVLAEPETRARMELQGMDLAAMPSEEFARVLDAETERWGAVVRENGIRADG